MNRYLDFEYPSTDLKRFIQSKTLFTIMLVDNRIVHYEAKEEEIFRKWLEFHNIQDIEME